MPKRDLVLLTKELVDQQGEVEGVAVGDTGGDPPFRKVSWTDPPYFSSSSLPGVRHRVKHMGGRKLQQS